MYFCIFLYRLVSPFCTEVLHWLADSIYDVLYVNILMALVTDLYIYEYTFWGLCDVYMGFLMFDDV
jgi:hypothetical protein